MTTARTIPTQIKPAQLRAVMGRDLWLPPHPFGPTGWKMVARDGDASVIVTQSPIPPGGDVTGARAWTAHDMTEWLHASMTARDDVPTYADLCRLKRAVWGDTGEAYQIHPPAAKHVNIHERALHLWGRADGRPVLPDFGVLGTI